MPFDCHYGLVQCGTSCPVMRRTPLPQSYTSWQDVAWHTKHEHMFGSVGDDKQLIIWDTRQSGESITCWCTFRHIDTRAQDCLLRSLVLTGMVMYVME